MLSLIKSERKGLFEKILKLSTWSINILKELSFLYILINSSFSRGRVSHIKEGRI